MKAYLGSVYVNDFNMFNRIYRVYIQAEANNVVTSYQFLLFMRLSLGGFILKISS